MPLELPHMPPRIAKLRRDHRGYPVPFFVSWIDGKPDHRIADQEKMHRAATLGLCNICGEKLGRYKCFVIGPMCSVNRLSAEPPVHTDCGDWAARVCPFLTIPAKRRRDYNKPVEAEQPAGHMIERNPGAVLLWITRTYKVIREPQGFLFRLGDPDETRWLCQGRDATREEVMRSYETGLPLLMAVAQDQGGNAVGELQRAYEASMQYLPA